MRTTFSPDHTCPQCQAVTVYWWVGTRGETRLMEVDHCRPHLCPNVPLPPAPPTATRCADCALSVYERDGVRYDEDAGLVRHRCPAQKPIPITPPGVVTPVPMRPLPPEVPTL